MTKKRSSEIFSTKVAFFKKSSIFSRKSSIFSKKSSIFPQNLYKFDLGFSGDFSVARLGLSIFLEWQHCLALLFAHSVKISEPLFSKMTCKLRVLQGSVIGKVSSKL